MTARKGRPQRSLQGHKVPNQNPKCNTIPLGSLPGSLLGEGLASNRGGWAIPRRAKACICFCTTGSSKGSRTGGASQHSPVSAVAQRRPGRVLDAVSSRASPSLLFFFLLPRWGTPKPRAVSSSCSRGVLFRVQEPLCSENTSKASPSPPSRRLQETARGQLSPFLEPPWMH